MGQAQPGSSTLNAPTGAVTVNATIVPAGAGGQIAVLATNPTELIIDVIGYFTAAGCRLARLFRRTPCRFADTRIDAGAFGRPMLAP